MSDDWAFDLIATDNKRRITIDLFMELDDRFGKNIFSAILTNSSPNR
jgi:hypothetical protein